MIIAATTRANDDEGSNPQRRSLYRSLVILKRNANKRRLATGLRLLWNGKFQLLRILLRLHIDFRGRLGNWSRDGRLKRGPVELCTEPAWPAHLPLVSIVIPCFNYGQFVRQAVKSAISQTFGRIEVIVVEGGSTDGTTASMVAQLNYPNLIKLFRDVPCKVGDNRNFGIRHSRGKYICCLDADDILRPTYVEKAVFLLERYCYDVVSSSVRLFGLVDEAYNVMPTPALSDMLAANHVHTAGLFRKSLWEEAGGYQDSAPGTPHVHEDWRFWVRLAALGARIANITNEHLLLYRVHGDGSLSRGAAVLPMDVQAEAIRELNSDVLTNSAFARSRDCPSKWLVSTQSLANMATVPAAPSRGPVILIAMPFLILGGAERLLSYVVRDLTASGFRFVIVTTIPAEPRFGDTTEWFEENTKEIYHLPLFLEVDLWMDFVRFLIMSKNIDIIWIVGSPFFYDILPNLKQEFHSLRVVDLLFNTIGHVDNNRRCRSLLDMILVENTEVLEWLLSEGEIPARIRMVRSGVDLDKLVVSRKPLDLMERIGLRPDDFVVGFSGRFSEEKGPLAFLEIAGRIPASLGVRFIMTGAGPLEHDVKQKIQSDGLDDRLHFAGLVPDITAYLACYDVLVVSSSFDGRPIVVLEALAMGIPVVAFDVGGLSELVIDGETGFLCEPHSMQFMADRILRLKQDPALHARLRRRARQFAEKNFAFAQTSAGFGEVFTELVPRPATHQADRNVDVDDICPKQPQRRCNACGAQRFTDMGRRSDGVTVMECVECGLGVAETIPPALKTYYDDAYYESAEDDDKVGYTDYRFMAEHGLSWAAALVTLLKDGGQVLDIGCADGTLLAKLPDGFERFGIEVNERMVARAAEADINILGRDLLDPAILQKYRGRFDIVTSIAVFEHLADLRAGMEVALALLKPDGVLLFEMPYISAKHENRVWFESSLEHVFYPSRDALRLLVEDLGAHLVGGEIFIRDYACTFVGLAFHDNALACRLKELFDSLTATGGLPVGQERTASQHLMMIHSGHTSLDLIKGIADLSAASLNWPLQQRLEQLWGNDLRRLGAMQDQLNVMQDRLAATQDRLAATQDRLALTEDRLASTEDRLASTEDRLAFTEDCLASTEDRLASTEDRLAAAQAHNIELEAQLSAAAMALGEVLASTSWKVTFPLRRLANLLPGISRLVRQGRKLVGLARRRAARH